MKRTIKDFVLLSLWVLPKNLIFQGLEKEAKPATLLKVTLLHVCFLRFLFCTNDTKWRKTSYILEQTYKTGRDLKGADTIRSKIKQFS